MTLLPPATASRCTGGHSDRPEDKLASWGLETPTTYFPDFPSGPDPDKDLLQGSACLLVLGQPCHSAVLVCPLPLVRGVLRQRHINL